MPKVHCLNVRLGACSIIQHGSGRVSMFDVNSALLPVEKKSYSMSANMSESWKPVPGAWWKVGPTSSTTNSPLPSKAG